MVIPCYNSASTIENLVLRIEEATVDQRFDVEVILVNDGSKDETLEITKRIAKEKSSARLLDLTRNFGQHNATLAGILASKGDIIVTMDDDLQHRPDQILKIITPLFDSSVNLIYGVPVQEEHGFLRSASSRFTKKFLALVGIPHAESLSAFRAFRGTFREHFKHVQDPNVNIDVVLNWITQDILPVEVTMNKREIGKSNYSVFKLMRHAINMVTGYGVIPLKIATFLGFFFGTLGALILMFELISYVFGINKVEGFTTLSALIAIFSGAQLLSLGIIGEYLGRQYFRTMNKPVFLIESTIEAIDTNKKKF